MSNNLSNNNHIDIENPWTFIYCLTSSSNSSSSSSGSSSNSSSSSSSSSSASYVSSIKLKCQNEKKAIYWETRFAFDVKILMLIAEYFTL
ncbi:hypothetical protein T4A_1561 [Trichinella pseudospiralis]|uniref:Uncharacterized protein n=1 Tax=Trichinella pseudospiralis TaxID=6337 RepID=A0A0V1K165_TRIPS|nr:hypothetical protein T4A_1561 [Trichinella pseudospiralis]KRZ40955.1 hypothetical protein T4C_2524 [Trichinella pseudospiralis]